jgi:hypothetical protein
LEYKHSTLPPARTVGKTREHYQKLIRSWPESWI